MNPRVHSRSRRRGKPADGFLSNLIDPIDRLVETIYSVLVLLTFTLAFRIFMLEPGAAITDDYVIELLTGATLAIVAWGVIDGIVYLLAEVLERGERHRILWYLHSADNQAEAVEVIADELDFILEPIASEDQRTRLYEDVVAHLIDNEPQPVKLKREDFIGASTCVLIAIVSVLPSFVPFLIFRNNYPLAIRISNLVSFAVLFYSGYEWGKYTGVNPWRIGFLLVMVGVLLVAIAIPFGG